MWGVSWCFLWANIIKSVLNREISVSFYYLCGDRLHHRSPGWGLSGWNVTYIMKSVIRADS